MTSIESLLHRRTDLSTFVVHFTRDTPPTSALDNLLSILKNLRLEARSVHGMARDLAERYPAIQHTQRAVCLTETPLEHAWMMCAQIDGRSIDFTGHGIAFTKTFARRRGANPVWYLDITPGHGWLTNPINAMIREADSVAWSSGEFDAIGLARAPVLQLTPFIEQMGPARDGGRKEFWWEREWRIVGDLHFSQSDIVAVFAPEDDHDALTQVLSTTGPYTTGEAMPTIVDANWGLERMISAYARVTPQDLGPFPR